MTCGFDKGLLAALYDGEVTPEERAEAERHAASCPECARDLESMKQMSAALKPLGRATAPLSIAEGVLREIGVDRPVRRPWVRWSGLAAAGLLACVATWYLVDDKTPAPRTELAAESPAKKPFARRDSSRSAESNAAIADSKLEAPAFPSRMEPAPPALESKKMKSEDLLSERKAHMEPAPSAPQVPVLLVSSANTPAARRTVEAFLKERQIPADAGPGLLGLGAFVRETFVSMDLSDGELEQLKVLLRSQLAAAATPLGAAEERARLSKADQGRGGVRPPADDKDAGSVDLEKEEKPALEFDRAKAAKKPEPTRRKIVLIFEDTPAK